MTQHILLYSPDIYRFGKKQDLIYYKNNWVDARETQFLVFSEIFPGLCLVKAYCEKC